MLIASGCSVTVVQTALGHASASTTLDLYSHLWPGDDDRIRHGRWTGRYRDLPRLLRQSHPVARQRQRQRQLPALKRRPNFCLTLAPMLTWD
jgi:hypothetical protein